MSKHKSRYFKIAYIWKHTDSGVSSMSCQVSVPREHDRKKSVLVKAVRKVGFR